MTPQRIQLSRKKGFRLPPNTVVVARPSKWGNPFQIADVIDAYDGNKRAAANDVKQAYHRWLREFSEGRTIAESAKTELRGKNLACWCKPGEPCHADVLLELANA